MLLEIYLEIWLVTLCFYASKFFFPQIDVES